MATQAEDQGTRMRERAKELAASAPRFTQQQRERLAALWRPVPRTHNGPAANVSASATNERRPFGR